MIGFTERLVADLLKRLAVFDVCNTLINENTTAGFVSFFVMHQGAWWRGFVVAAILRRWSPLRIVFAVVYRIGGPDLPRWALIRQLRGATKTQLEATAQEYVDAVMTHERVIPVWQLLERERQKGAELVLASASLCVVVAALATRIGAVPFSSTLRFCDDACTGHLDQDLTGRKLNAVSAYIEAKAEGIYLIACSDNVSDMPLLAAADEGYAVCTRKSHRLRGHPLPTGVQYISAE